MEDATAEAITPYSMHVSSKYLDLTRKKLELTRLPRELELPEHQRWAQGTPKTVLEPLLDYWLEHYDWRAQEAHFNSTLPQYRTTINLPSSHASKSSQSLRIHFVHKCSSHSNAIPLLFCHSRPSSFIEVSKIIDALTDPPSLPSSGNGAQQAFHVIAPSIPGFGFSDASSLENFGLTETAAVFNGVMERLGYKRYVAHGEYHLCRALALNHGQNCVAVHVINPTFPEPTFRKSPMAFFKYRIARLTRARISALCFGYIPSELHDVERLEEESSQVAQPWLGSTLSHLYLYRPQTLAFSLCDSPVGLLANLLDVIHSRALPLSPVASRSRSPFLSPAELEMEESHQNGAPQETGIRATPGEDRAQPLSAHDSEGDSRHYSWAPSEVLNWTMLQWLPGPEAILRFLGRAHVDASASSTAYCPVPLGISSFRGRNSDKATTPIMWGNVSWRIDWVKRHGRPATFAAWEAADAVVLDLREFFESHAAAINLPTQASW